MVPPPSEKLPKFYISGLQLPALGGVHHGKTSSPPLRLLCFIDPRASRRTQRRADLFGEVQGGGIKNE